MVFCEPLRANLEFGQINVVLMTLVIADCVPRRTYWPRGALLGVAVALKLTPAVFLLYFLLRRDRRAAVTTVRGWRFAPAAPGPVEPAPLAPREGEYAFDAWLRIGTDGVVTVAVPP